MKTATGLLLAVCLATVCATLPLAGGGRRADAVDGVAFAGGGASRERRLIG